jgi:hypothetical protein
VPELAHGGVAGLITNTFSTLVAQLLAAWIGGEAAVGWMITAAIPLRDRATQVKPEQWFTLTGILIFP